MNLLKRPTLMAAIFAAITSTSYALDGVDSNDNAAMSEEAREKMIATLKRGYEIVEENCASCHLSPFDTAKIYTQRQWKNRFRTKRPTLAEEVRTKFYKKHKINDDLFKNLITTTNTYESQAFLYYYAKDSGRSRCLSKEGK